MPIDDDPLNDPSSTKSNASVSAPSNLPKDKSEAALGLAIPATFITLGSAFLYLTGYMFLAGFWTTCGIDLSLLGLSTGDILTFSYFPNVYWAIRVAEASVVFVGVFILLRLSGLVRVWARRMTDGLSNSLRSFELALPCVVLMLIVLPLASDFLGKFFAKDFLQTAGSQNKVYVTFKPDLKQGDQHHVALASNAGRLFLLGQTKDLVMVAEKTGNSRIHTYIVSRSDLLSVEVSFSTSK